METIMTDLKELIDLFKEIKKRIGEKQDLLKQIKELKNQNANLSNINDFLSLQIEALRGERDNALSDLEQQDQGNSDDESVPNWIFELNLLDSNWD